MQKKMNNSPSKLILTNYATSKFTTYEIIYLIHITTMKPFFSKLKTSFNKLTIFFCRRSTIQLTKSQSRARLARGPPLRCNFFIYWSAKQFYEVMNQLCSTWVVASNQRSLHLLTFAKETKNKEKLQGRHVTFDKFKI